MKILFVCTGNICRSPTAEAVFRRLVAEAGIEDNVEIESAGTHGYHVGEPPDSRTEAAAAARGYDMMGQTARQLEEDDFRYFDMILAMDRGHRTHLQRTAPPGTEQKIRMFMDFAPEAAARDVPDPYYGGPEGFDQVLDMIEAGARGLLGAVRGGRAF